MKFQEPRINVWVALAAWLCFSINLAWAKEYPPVSALQSGDLVCEAEEFRMAGSGWVAKDWGENYFAATFANTFMSRKKYLSAGAEVRDAWAYRKIDVPRPGKYLVLVRYESPDRFGAHFTVVLDQGGKEKFRRAYGRLQNDKIWPFQGKNKRSPKPLWRPSWGTGEQMAWEGHSAWVSLEQGEATIGLHADPQEGLVADRNIDLVLLTANSAEVTERLEKEKYLPLDGLLTQEGDLNLTIENLADKPLRVKIPPGREHSPYWVHLRKWKKLDVTVPPGQSSSMAVGQLLDSLNDGDWHLSFSEGAKYRLRFTTPQGPGLSVVSEQEKLVLAYDADTRYSGRIRLQSEVVEDLVKGLEDGRNYRFPKSFPVYGILPNPRPQDVAYTHALGRLKEIFPLRERASPSRVRDGYVDVRGKGKLEDLESFLAEVRRTDGEGAVNFACFGDEIALPKPPKEAPGFLTWVQRQYPELKSPDFGYDPSNEVRGTNPLQFYLSRRYRNAFGLDSLRQRTDSVKSYFPKAETGANFSPHRRAFYLGDTMDWITLFRKNAMTVPWSEDYIWQVPVGSQQMSFLTLDLARAANRGRTDPRIIRYVMPHSPGNIPSSWRRQFFGSLGHGMTDLDLFEFRPVQTSYTENSVSSLEMYQEVRRSLDQLSGFEDLLKTTQVMPGKVALWCSETGDIWDNNGPPMGPARRSLYIMLRHLQHNVEFVTPEDDLRDIQVLCVTDLHVSLADARKLTRWVEAGGQVVLTGGAGFLDEVNSPNRVMQRLAGLRTNEPRMFVDPSIVFVKQDLPYAKTVGHLQNGVPCFGVRAGLEVEPGTEVLTSFKNGAPAVVRSKRGKGVVTSLAYLPGLSYFHPAIPKRPMDRGNTPESMSHFIPEDFDFQALKSLGDLLPLVERPIECDDKLVACNLLVGENGVVAPIVQWRQSTGEVTVSMEPGLAQGEVSLASGKSVERVGQGLFRFELEVADALVIRR